MKQIFLMALFLVVISTLVIAEPHEHNIRELPQNCEIHSDHELCNNNDGTFTYFGFEKPINPEINNEFRRFSEVVDFNFQDSSFKLIFEDKSLDLVPKISINSNIISLRDINIPDTLFRTQITESRDYKYGFGIDNIPNSILRRIDFFELSIENIQGDLQLETYTKEICIINQETGECDYINSQSLILNNFIELNFDDLIYTGFSVEIIDNNKIRIRKVNYTNNEFLDPTISYFSNTIDGLIRLDQSGCTGTPTNCYGLTEQQCGVTSNDPQYGCYWDYFFDPPICNGVVTQCSSLTSNQCVKQLGCTIGSTISTTLTLGEVGKKTDITPNQERRSFLSFDTSGIPDNMVVTNAILHTYIDSYSKKGTDNTNLWNVQYKSRKNYIGSQLTNEDWDLGCAPNNPSCINEGTLDWQQTTGWKDKELLSTSISITGTTDIELIPTWTVPTFWAITYPRLTDYSYSGYDPYLEVTYTLQSASNVQYIYSGNTRRDDISNEVVYYTKDPISSTSIITDSAGEVIQKLEYLPFGPELQTISGNLYNNIKFAGKEKDQSLNIYDFSARNYDQNNGRFYSIDPVLKATSPYVYALNNPYKYTDPSGMNDVLNHWTDTKQSQFSMQLRYGGSTVWNSGTGMFDYQGGTITNLFSSSRGQELGYSAFSMLPIGDLIYALSSTYVFSKATGVTLAGIGLIGVPMKYGGRTANLYLPHPRTGNIQHIKLSEIITSVPIRRGVGSAELNILSDRKIVEPRGPLAKTAIERGRQIHLHSGESYIRESPFYSGTLANVPDISNPNEPGGALLFAFIEDRNSAILEFKPGLHVYNVMNIRQYVASADELEVLIIGGYKMSDVQNVHHLIRDPNGWYFKGFPVGP